MKKNIWGPCIWNTLHILSIKVKESSFEKIKDELIDIINQIISNLPCPICSTHARSLLKKHRIHNIKSKQDLIHLIFLLHNDVNKRLKKDIFSKDDLKKYEEMDFKKTLIEYYKIIGESKYSEKMLLYSYHKNIFMKTFKQFAKKSLNYFET